MANRKTVKKAVKRAAKVAPVAKPSALAVGVTVFVRPKGARPGEKIDPVAATVVSIESPPWGERQTAVCTVKFADGMTGQRLISPDLLEASK